MSRIFLALAAIAVVLLSANLLVGISIGDWGKASQTYQSAYRQHQRARADSTASLAEVDAAHLAAEAAAKLVKQQRRRFDLHIWLGMSAALVTLLVNSISITYFIGTNRWCREVVDAFSLDHKLAERSQRLKRQAFPWSFIGILLILAIAGLGGAADPARPRSELAADWVLYHWALAMIGLVAISASLLAQVSVIGKNSELIHEILVAAEAERARRKAVCETAAGK